jgi:trehalose 6-phosphate phosphatase
VPLAGVVGNHGLEPWDATTRAGRQVRRWFSILGERLDGIPGVVIEDKGLSLAVHYRAARRKNEARTRIHDAAARLGDVRLVGGKQVLNVLPAGAAGKGRALERARVRLGCDTAVYVGDDETDEDVFALDAPGRLLGIRVGRSTGSAAGYFLRTQAEIDLLLRSLLAFRPEPPAGRGRKARSAGRAGRARRI